MTGEAPSHHLTTQPTRLGWPVELLTVFALGVGLMRWTYGTSEGVPGNDSYYHVKMAAMLPEYGLMREFPWLRFVYFTDSGNEFVSHHYGFHVLLAPFVLASRAISGDCLEGAKWAMSGFFGLNIALFAAVLRACGVRGRWFWLAWLVLMPPHFFTRHAFVRAIAPSLSCMLLITWGLIRGRGVILAIAVAAYVHVYLGGLLYAPALVGAYAAACLAAQPRRQLSWRLVLAAVIGWIVGVATHPYSNGLAQFLRLQVLGTGLSPDISVGREWQPYSDVWWFAQVTGATFGLWVAALVVRLRGGVPMGAAEFMLLGCHFGFLVLTLKARRFVEYWPLFCVLSAATLAGPWWNRVVAVVERMGSGTTGTRRWAQPLIRKGLSAGCIVAAGIVVATAPTWQAVRGGAKCEFDLSAIGSAMTFLAANSDPGDVVFTDDWDVFPVYFYYNTHNHYIVGLDPKFTHHRDPVLWERYVKVSRGQVPADMEVETHGDAGESAKQQVHAALEDIRDYFGAKFAITDRDHKALAGKLAKATEFAELVYPSTNYVESKEAPYLIFRIRPEVPKN
jgi:hypothetical protein